MPVIHRHLGLLQEKLAKFDPQNVQKRVGNNYTVFFEVDEVKFDPNIPVLTDSQLSKFMRVYVTSPGTETSTTDILPQPSISKVIETKTKKSSNSGIKVKVRPRHKPSTFTVQPVAPGPASSISTSSLSTSPRPKSSSSATSEPSTTSLGTTAIWKGDIDELVINEPIDDEYSMYDDEDFSETELSKNLKKIRADPPCPNPAAQPKLSKSMEPTKPDKPRIFTYTHITPTQPQQPPRPKTPPKPNWIETVKQLQTNQIMNVYKDLVHFKDYIKMDSTAKSLPKEVVMKCLQEDETNMLVDLLALVYELDYQEDTDFWSELVLRLKRKLNTHSNVTNFKVKINPELIVQNYRRAILSINEYAKSSNLTFKLPYHAMVFLIDPIQTCNRNTNITAKPNGATNNNSYLPQSLTSTKPTEGTSLCDMKPDIPQPGPSNQSNCNSTNGDFGCKIEPLQTLNRFKVLFPDIKPKIKIEKKENVSPADERQVTLSKNASGQICFKIRRGGKKK